MTRTVNQAGKRFRHDGLKVIHFRSVEKPNEDIFCLELSEILSYEDVTRSIASHLGLSDPTKIRLTSQDCYYQQPKSQPIQYKGDIETSYNQTYGILYYEVLDTPLPELQGLKTLNVAFHHATEDEVLIRSVTLTKQSTVGDLINDLKTKVDLSHPNAELRLFEVYYHRIYKIYPPSEKIVNIGYQKWSLRAEEIPEEEKNSDPLDHLIHVCHITKDASHNKLNFGKPFLLIIHRGETLAEVKVRIQKKLHVPDDEFYKWKFKFCRSGRRSSSRDLHDSDILSSCFQKIDVYEACNQYLGLEHSNNAARTNAANRVIHFRSLEKANEDDFILNMPGILTYVGVSERVNSHLGLDDSSKIRLTFHNCEASQPRSQPITYNGEINTSYNQTSDILYYEVLDTPLPELQGLKTLNVAFHHATKDEILIRSITLPVHSTVGDVIDNLKTKVELSHPNAELRLVDVYRHTIRQIFPLTKHIQRLKDNFRILRAEEIQVDEKNLGPRDLLICAYHFTKDASGERNIRVFGEPFLLIIHDGETLAEVRVRIQKKLHTPDDEFSKWKFTLCSSGRQPLKYLQDSDIITNHFQSRDGYEICRQYLGLEHSIAPRRADVANQNRLKTEEVELEEDEEEEQQHKKQKAEAHLYSVIKQENDELLPPYSEYTDSLQLMEVEPVSATPMPCEVTVPTSTTQSGELRPLPEYPSAGQLYEEGRYRHEAFLLGEKFEDVGGFSILKTQAFLYKRIWSKYGHIASSQVLSASLYSSQIAVVSEIMNSIMDMHHCHLAEVSSAMIDLWEDKLKVAEKLAFNIRWLRERFEDVKKGYYGNRKLKTSLAVQVQSLQTARVRVLAVKDELKKTEEDMNVLETRISPLLAEERIYVKKGSCLLFDGLL